MNFKFSVACRLGNLEFVEYCLKQKDLVIDYQDFESAVRFSQTNVVKKLLQDPRFDPSANSNSLIRIAAQKGNLEIFKCLLNDSRVDPSDNENAAINIAEMWRHDDIVDLLLDDDRVNPSIYSNTILRQYCCRGNMHLVRKILQNKHSRPIGCHPALFACVGNGIDNMCSQDKILKIVLEEKRFDFNDKMMMHNCFMHAFRNKSFKCCDLLVNDLRIGSKLFDLDVCFENLKMIQTRAATIYFAMQDLQLPALLTLFILDEIFPNQITMWSKWQLITKIKHFLK